MVIKFKHHEAERYKKGNTIFQLSDWPKAKSFIILCAAEAVGNQHSSVSRARMINWFILYGGQFGNIY